MRHRAPAAAVHYLPVELCKANSLNLFNYLTYVLSNECNKAVRLPTPDEFAGLSATPTGGCVL